MKFLANVVIGNVIAVAMLALTLVLVLMILVAHLTRTAYKPMWDWISDVFNWTRIQGERAKNGWFA